MRGKKDRWKEGKREGGIQKGKVRCGKEGYVDGVGR